MRRFTVWIILFALLGIGYNAYHWSDGLTQNRIGYVIGKIFKNEKEAYRWFKKSADKGNPRGNFNLGHYYLCGKHGIEINYLKAFELIQKAANQNYPSAQSVLGQCYYFGEGTEKNDLEAFRWYKKAAENGSIEGQLNLGSCYNTGIGTAVNDTEAFRWFGEAAKQGSPEGLERVAECYRKGQGVEKNPKAAFQYFKEASLKNSKKADGKLASMYYLGEGTEINYKSAYVLWTKASSLEDPESLVGVGICKLYGHGTEKDLHFAYQKFAQAAKANSALGQFYLAKCYEEGISVKQDKVAARKLYEASARQGEGNAKQALARLQAEDDAQKILLNVEKKQDLQPSTNPH